MYGVVTYGYDSSGKLDTITRGSTEYNLTYNSWNQPISTKVGTTALSTNTYDNQKRLSTVTYANGFSARYVYDDLDRVKQIYHTVSHTETLAYEMVYNGEGDLYEIRNYLTHRASFFEYDHAGRCMASREYTFTGNSANAIVYGSVLSSYGYQYDTCNNLTKLTCSVLGSTWNTVYTYDADNRAKTTTLSSGKVITNTYDAIGRLTKRTLGLSTTYNTVLTYTAGNATNKTTGLIATYKNGSDDTYNYTYDNVGNITSITRGSSGSNPISYVYDSANRLIRENNSITNITTLYEYDQWGNIQNKKLYYYTTATTLGTPVTTVPYVYGNSAWGDQLTSYNGTPISYDEMGNPTSYRGYSFTWRGKQLIGASNSSVSVSFEYNEDGLRQKKTVNNLETDYYYNGSVLIGMQRGTSKFLFSYDASGNVVSVNYNGTEYYYLRNAQGDIVKLIDASGATVVEYTYDTWGKKVTMTGSLAGTLGLLQPFRYRGYVYDWELGFYYLQSRYYDPAVGRFISADILLSTGQGVLGHNCYAYCLDNPVRYKDSQGMEAEEGEQEDEPSVKALISKNVKRARALKLLSFVARSITGPRGKGLKRGISMVSMLAWFAGNVNTGAPMDYKDLSRWEEAFGYLYLQIHLLFDMRIAGCQCFDLGIRQRRFVNILAGAGRGFARHDLPDKLLLCLDRLPHIAVKRVLGDIAEDLNLRVVIALSQDASFALSYICRSPRNIQMVQGN